MISDGGEAQAWGVQHPATIKVADRGAAVGRRRVGRAAADLVALLDTISSFWVMAISVLLCMALSVRATNPEDRFRRGADDLDLSLSKA
ncbi:hypothetical protein GQR99_00060 [Cereibacter sphaeroides]|nr:hypothetical protein GQR99_00060 [Cereibacter sphaeroides]